MLRVLDSGLEGTFKGPSLFLDGNTYFQTKEEREGAPCRSRASTLPRLPARVSKSQSALRNFGLCSGHHAKCEVTLDWENQRSRLTAVVVMELSLGAESTPTTWRGWSRGSRLPLPLGHSVAVNKSRPRLRLHFFTAK